MDPIRNQRISLVQTRSTDRSDREPLQQSIQQRDIALSTASAIGQQIEDRSSQVQIYVDAGTSVSASSQTLDPIRTHQGQESPHSIDEDSSRIDDLFNSALSLHAKNRDKGLEYEDEKEWMIVQTKEEQIEKLKYFYSQRRELKKVCLDYKKEEVQSYLDSLCEIANKEKEVIKYLFDMYIQINTIRMQTEIQLKSLYDDFKIYLEKMSTEESKIGIIREIQKKRMEAGERVEEEVRKYTEYESILMKYDQIRRLKLDESVAITVLQADREVVEEMRRSSNKAELNARILMHNQFVMSKLPEIQRGFIDEYSKSVAARNSNVKNIMDKIELPTFEPDEIGMLHIQEGLIQSDG